MPEIALQTVAVPLNQCSDEREVQMCHQHNKQGFGLQPLAFTNLRPPGSTEPSPCLTRMTAIDPGRIDVF